MVASLFSPEFSYRQTQALDDLDNPAVAAVLYGGAKGGGKSYLGCAWLYLTTLNLIKQYGLKPCKNPPVLAWMGRRLSTDFRQTTLETWKEIIPEGTYVIREQKKEIVILGSATIAFGGLDKQHDVHRFNSDEKMLLFLDQAEEVPLSMLGEWQASLRKTIKGERPYCGYTTLYTANPRDCWLRDEFVDSLKRGASDRFVPALPSDNPNLPEGYENMLRKAFRHRPELVEAYLNGNWDLFESDSALIRRQWIRDAAARGVIQPYPKKLVVCDVARFGDAETVIYDMSDTQITLEEIYGQKATTFTAQRLFIHQKRLGGCLVVVDDTGVGGGVTDQLRDMGVSVFPFDGAAKPTSETNEVKFYNVRAEAWWKASQGFCDGDVCLDYDDDQLHRDLSAPHYDFRGKKIIVEKKQDIKDRLGRSPDRGDAYVMGLYALPHAWSPEKRLVEANRTGDVFRRHKRPRTTMSA